MDRMIEENDNWTEKKLLYLHEKRIKLCKIIALIG